jgi:hypothetical protein
MADLLTRADALRLYLTGAGSNGGSQSAANSALGNYRSSTEVAALSASRASSISNVTLDYIAARNGPGTGTLTATGNDTLTWTPPGGSAGADVTILNGESKVLEGGGDPSKYVRVTRTSTSNLSGTETDTLTEVLNNVIGLDNTTSAEAAAGDDNYRAICLKNGSGSVTMQNITAWIGTLGTQRTSGTAQLGSSGAGTITSATSSAFADWPNSGFCHIKTSGGSTREIVYYSSRTDTSLTVPSAGRAQLGTSAAAGAFNDTLDAVPGIRIAKEAPTGSASAGNAQTIANEATAPTGVTWSTAITQGTGVSIGTLAPGEIYFLWIHRHVVAGSVAEASVRKLVEFSYDAA